MQSLALATSWGQRVPMTVSADSLRERELLGRALAVLRERASLSQTVAGERFGVSGQNFGKYERGQAPSIEQRSVQERLAMAVGSTREALLEERDRLAGVRSNVASIADRIIPRPDAIPVRHSALLPLRDRVQAGAWLLADDTAQVMGNGHPVGYDSRYPTAQQWLSAVSGDSVDQLGIFDGDLVHCVDAVDIRYHPRTGDLVEVERTRFQGSERELTLKQIELTPSGVLLWPRSSNPRWQQPLDLTEGLEREDEDVVVRVRGLVVAVVRRF